LLYVCCDFAIGNLICLSGFYPAKIQFTLDLLKLLEF